ncbi:hypothetical protein [Campylobacter sp.]|uniref:hypothetical protein n=1 Tax=Campylobacter sp. TaxID=205 RepID=UPI0025B99ADC|nr:hypothetical protein [Campylobacter sp.]
MERIICLLICLCFFKVVAQDEFIFWAELSNKNLMLFHQNETISMAMTKSKNKKLEFACEIPYSSKDFITRGNVGRISKEGMTKIDKFNFLNTHKSDLIDCFLNSKIDVKDFTNTNLASAQSETYVKILPLRFIVEFGDYSFFIYYLK